MPCRLSNEHASSPTKRGTMSQQAPPTYLPGDTITLVLQLEHEVNLKEVVAVFQQHTPQQRSIALQGAPRRIQAEPPEDQVKSSEVRLSTTVNPNEHSPGDYLLHEVVAISAEEQKLRVHYTGRKASFRIEEEPTSTEVRARSVALELPNSL
jgi:hypothetical protein